MPFMRNGRTRPIRTRFCSAHPAPTKSPPRMRALIFVHRWLGVAFCLLFAMWFASGIVMHFVPFPHLNEAERFAALPRVDLRRVNFAPIDALRASGLGPTSRIRLMQRSDGPVYIVAEGRRVKALQA